MNRIETRFRSLPALRSLFGFRGPLARTLTSGPSLVTRRLVPLALFSAAGLSALYLWQGLGGGSARGFAVTETYVVSAPELGRIKRVFVKVGSRVNPGDPLAELDPAPLLAEKAILAAEKKKVRSEIAAVEFQTAAKEALLDGGLASNEDSTELGLAEARAELVVKRTEADALSLQLRETKALYEKRLIERKALDELSVRQAVSEAELKSSLLLVARLSESAGRVRRQREARPEGAVARAVEPLDAEYELLSEKERQLERRLGEMTLRAPVAGQVSAIHLLPGGTLEFGGPVVSLVAELENAEVRLCLPPEQKDAVAVGQGFRVVFADGARLPVVGRVTGIAAEVAELDPRCRRKAEVLEFGREVYGLVDARILPGTSFRVEFTDDVKVLPKEAPPSRSDDRGESKGSSSGVQPDLRPVTVPGSLGLLSRTEASGLLWSEELGKFLVATDDTGRSEKEKHKAWLLTLDEGGRFGDSPLTIRGLNEVNDLESLARAPSGGFYLMASQSLNKKGVRTPARGVFGRVKIEAGELRLVAAKDFASALTKLPAPVLLRLGIRDVADLEIEGMTATKRGGLLLGLKRPLSPTNRAYLWHFKSPEEFLVSGALRDDDLEIDSEVLLPLEGGGREVFGGVSELLEAPDGSLLVAATPSRGEPLVSNGAVFRVSEGAEARRLWSFPGRKPEALAFPPDGKKLLILFDEGEGRPLWAEAAWPPR